jgi:hypothetical protein
VGGRIKRTKSAVVKLPAVPCTIADAPIGAAVQIGLPCGSALDQCPACGVGDAQIGRSGWMLITFKIGDTARGSRNLRSFGTLSPDEIGWVETPDHCHLVAPDVRVISIGWPRRAADAELELVTDPVSGAISSSGPLFVVDRDGEP